MVAHEEDSPVPRSHPFYAGGAPPLPESTNTPPLPPSYNYDDPPPPMPPFEHFSPPVPFDAPLPPQPSSEQQKQLEGEEERGRKRKSKWGDPSKRILIGGIHAPLPASMNATQLLLYLVQSRLEEIDRKLRSGDVIPPERDRSPSPPPTYDGQGKRTNTRDLRYKKKLEDEKLLKLMGAKTKLAKAPNPLSRLKKTIKLKKENINY